MDAEETVKEYSKMMKVDTKLMNMTLACLCKQGEQPAYQKVNLDGLLGVLRDSEKFCKFSDNARKTVDCGICYDLI